MTQFHRDREDGTPFLRIFFAVLLALIVYGLLQAAVAALFARAALDEINRQVQEATATAHHVARADQTAPPAHLPSLPGPVQAKRDGKPQACIGGLISQRLASGWDQGRERCVAWSD